MQHNTNNDSPRQPVWTTRTSNPKAVVWPVGYINQPDRRCICGARPTPAGDLPCGH